MINIISMARFTVFGSNLSIGERFRSARLDLFFPATSIGYVLSRQMTIAKMPLCL